MLCAAKVLGCYFQLLMVRRCDNIPDMVYYSEWLTSYHLIINFTQEGYFEK